MTKLRKTVRLAGLLAATLSAGIIGIAGFTGITRTAHAADSWTAAGWSGGGLYWSAALHPTRPDVIYMGGDVAGVYQDRGCREKLAADQQWSFQLTLDVK